MAARVLHVFVRHVSLLRNLGEGGKLRLAADMAQVRSGGRFLVEGMDCDWEEGEREGGKGV
jgi:hypothetical protein